MNVLPYQLSEIAGIVGGEWKPGNTEPTESTTHIAYDSRKIYAAATTIFLALPGAQRNGHDYIDAAYRKGVRHFWVEDTIHTRDDCHVLVVADTWKALQQLAAHHRAKLVHPVIGITGSNGKTIVKEWLGQLLTGKYRVNRSPGSYNSQLGVALSLLEADPKADFTLIEAGISRTGEMERLAEMVRPDYGIMTHFGDAHAEGFASEGEKLREKVRLFRDCRQVFAGADDGRVVGQIQESGVELRTVGRSEAAGLRLLRAGGEGFSVQWVDGEIQEFAFAQYSDADLENLLLALLTAESLGIDRANLQHGVDQLDQVDMRTQILTDNPDIVVLNDTYSADRTSVQNAFSLLERFGGNDKIVILSDLVLPESEREAVHRELLDQAVQRFGARNIFLIGPEFYHLAENQPGVSAFPNVNQFIVQFSYERFRDHVVLLKGSRRFKLERLLPHLSLRPRTTHLRISLDHLEHNYRQVRQFLPEPVRLMIMVKALGYGAGDWQIAQALRDLGVDYLGVAYTAEGIQLRRNGIESPIMVMNPDPQHLDQLFPHRLEPVAFSPDRLLAYIREGRKAKLDEIRVHLEVDTGMGRLGFQEKDLPELQQIIDRHPELRIVSIMSHLAVADEPEQDAFTHRQAARFEQYATAIRLPENHPPPLRQLLNTAGMLRFPEYHYDMVRLGIGLYGVTPISTNDLNLQEITSLHSVVTQVHEYPAGTPVGYGGAEVTQRPSRIATVAIGYADGIRRTLGNGNMSFLVRGQRAPVFGRVCMDMLMLDVTDLPKVEAGDQVVIWGQQGDNRISVNDIASASDTIAYEVLVNVGQRVNRIYEHG